METVPMLGDVDDEKHYAQLLEVAYVEAWCEVDKICKDAYFGDGYKSGGPPDDSDLKVGYADLTRLRFVMAANVEQSVNRRRRLADITAGLPDVVLQKEGTKE